MMLTNMLNLSHMLTMYLFMTARIVQMMLNCIFTTAKNNANDANGGKQMLLSNQQNSTNDVYDGKQYSN